MKLQAEGPHCIKKETSAQLFSFTFCEIFKKICFVEHLQKAASAQDLSLTFQLARKNMFRIE